MAVDVSGFGFVITLKASTTFPAGIDLSQFADDSDPFDFPEVAIVDGAMGLNGDLVTWSRAMPLKATCAVIAGSDDDLNLAALLEANRVGRGKTSAQDTITCTSVYPSGRSLSLTQGKITEGPHGTSVSSAGRLKTKIYHFIFENRVGTGI